MLKFLGIGGLLFILSLFTDNGLILTAALTLFVIAVVLNCARLWKGQDVLSAAIDTTYENSVEYMKNKEYGKAGVYFMALPMIFVGIFFAVILLFCMWVMAV